LPVCVTADLSQNGLIGASGEDAASFLQGQLTCDVRSVTEKHSLLGAYLSPKGRILASFRILRLGGDFVLRVHPSVLEGTIKRLRMFVLRSRVEIEDQSDRLVVFGIAGSAAEARIRASLGGAPSAVDESIQIEGTSVVRVPGPVPRFEVYAAPELASRLWSAVNAVTVGQDIWQLLDIRSGLPSIGAATADAFLPQMVNLELVGGISFTKGCYSGQEIVARTQYLGRPKRRMYRATVRAASKPEIGDSVVDDANEGNSDVGKVLSAASNPNGGFEILAVLQTASVVARSKLRLSIDPDAQLDLRELPYPVTADT